jgi:hypothetical protein
MLIGDTRGRGSMRGTVEQETDIEQEIFDNVCEDFKVSSMERRQFQLLADKEYQKLFDLISPYINESKWIDLVRIIMLNLLGETIPALYDKESNDYEPDIYTAMADLEKLVDKISNPEPARRDLRPSNTDRGRSSPSTFRGGSRNSGRRTQSASINNTRRNNDMFDPDDHRTQGETIRQNTPPFKAGKNVTEVVVEKLIPVTVPGMVDRTAAFDPTIRTGLNGGESIECYQLCDIGSNFGDYPVLYKHWVEERMAYGLLSVDEPSVTAIENIFNELGEVATIDRLVALIKELQSHGKLETVYWLSNRISALVLDYLDTKFEMRDQESFPLLTRPDDCIEYLKDANILDQVSKLVTVFINKLFSNWYFFRCETHEEDTVSAEDKLSIDTVVVLRYTVPILILPYITSYQRISKTFKILTSSVEENVANFLVQKAFVKIPPTEHELYICDKSYNLYKTTRWIDEKVENMEHAIVKA